MEPVFYSGGPSGVVEKRACPSAAFTLYLQKICQRLAYPDEVDSNSLRRKAATDLLNVFGVDFVRKLMNHGPNSKVLERYYDMSHGRWYVES